MASWLMRSHPDGAVQAQALSGDTVLCSLAKHFTPDSASPHPGV